MLRALIIALAFTVPAQAAPARIVSLNPCLDAVLVEVAERSQIAAVSHYARDPHASSIAEIAATLPITYESAEEVIVLAPDLVMTSRHSALATRNALRRLGIQTELFDVPDTVEASVAQIRRIAHLTGHPEKGEALVARIEAAIAAATPAEGTPLIPAALMEPNGFTVGADTLTDELFRRTGFENVAARYGVGKSGNISLERLIADPPRVLFAGEPDPMMPGWAERVVRHPAMRKVSKQIIRAEFPQRLMYCGGAVIVESAAILAQTRAQILGARP